METLKLIGKGVFVGVCALVTFYSGVHAIPEILRELGKLNQSLDGVLSPHLASILGALILATALTVFFVELAIRRRAHRKAVMGVSVLFAAIGLGLVFLPSAHKDGPPIVKAPHPSRHGTDRVKAPRSQRHQVRQKAKHGDTSHEPATQAISTSGESGEGEAATSSVGGSPCTCPATAPPSASRPPTKSPCGCSSPPPSTTRPTPAGSGGEREEPEWEEEEEWEEEPEWEEEEF